MSVFRVPPRGPVEAYKTYQVTAPRSHYRPASCAEVDCPDYLNGWQMIVELTDERVLYAVRSSGRRFTETAGPVTVTFDFEAGGPCQKPSLHRVLVRPELYVVRGGDWRGNRTGFRRQHKDHVEFVEDFGEHQQRINDELQKG